MEININFVRRYEIVHVFNPKNPNKMKTLIVGKLVKVFPNEVKANYTSQKIEIHVLEFDSLTGEMKKPEIYQSTIFNKKIAELDAVSKLGFRVAATCYLKSLESEKDGTTFYNIALNTVNLQIV